MRFESKKTPLLILGLTSIVCSRVLFVFFNDTEGPNLLIVIALAAIVYVVSLVVYLFDPSIKDLKRLVLAISTQILTVAGLYLFLN